MITKNLIIALFISLGFNGLFGYLSYSFYGSKVKAEQAFTMALDANKALENSIKLQDKACFIQDNLSSELQIENKDIEEKKQEIVSKIDQLIISPKKGPTSPKVGMTNEETNVAGIDDLLPPELKRLSDEVYYSLQRQGASDAE